MCQVLNVLVAVCISGWDLLRQRHVLLLYNQACYIALSQTTGALSARYSTEIEVKDQTLGGDGLCGPVMGEIGMGRVLNVLVAVCISRWDLLRQRHVLPLSNQACYLALSQTDH